jgi:hypothetical protein
MRIYGEIDHRLDSVVKFDSISAETHYLLVVHPNNTQRWIEDELPERITHPYCRGILLVKGVPRAGIGDEEFERLKDLYGSRFHISARAVGTEQEDTRLSDVHAARFARFFQYARSKDVLDWNILDPPWPESVVAVYLLARVMSTDAQAAELIENARNDWEPIWEEAKREFESLTGDTMTHARLARNNSAEITTQIGPHLQKIVAQIPCEAAMKRGILRHSWLKNQILPINPEYVVRVRNSQSLLDVRRDFERLIGPNGEFSVHLDVAAQLARNLEAWFSPAQLVDLGPLAIVPNDIRKIIKSNIHAEYLDRNGIEKQRAPIANAVKDLRKALNEFTASWFQRPSVSEDLIRDGFVRVQMNAAVLQDALGYLPEGFVLS